MFFCAEDICIGDSYDFRSGVNEDGFYTMYMHPECNLATINWKQEDYEIFSGSRLKRGTCLLK